VYFLSFSALPTAKLRERHDGSCKARGIMQRSKFAVAFTIGIFARALTGCGSDPGGTTQGTGGSGGTGGGSDAALDGPAVDDVSDDVVIIDANIADGGGIEDTAPDVPDLPRFSFFYTSLDAMRRLSGSPNGFGGDLRFGMPTGIEGADKICQTIASEIGFGAKTWRALLSANRGPSGATVHAIERIGNGPWYDRKGRLFAQDRAGLLMERPAGDPDLVNDLPDETGEGTSPLGHSSAITGSNTMGRLYSNDAKNTCNDWTSTTLEGIFVMAGHPGLTGGAGHWLQSHPERSCVPGVRLGDAGNGDGSSIGSGGGWGGFYCFALSP
jgi:hypothetical protein